MTAKYYAEIVVREKTKKHVGSRRYPCYSSFATAYDVVIHVANHAMCAIFLDQEYLESSLRYLHRKFVTDVGGHRTENIKASMLA